ncbi:hypothetical protein [Streptomyces albus]|uniref:hypothetical protein n=1 Tax=Streptomyces sp. NRRL F-5917 TaxID=1463873 RepID=UPI0004C29702|nr:hypothetical protein [Streptomyces sp. NRRL F-5917]
MEHVAIIDGQHHTVDAIEPVPGLRVYKHPHRDYGIGTYPVCLGHHEGRRIARTECTADAIDAARDLAEMADWTQPETEIQAAPGLAEKVADYFAGHNAIWAGGYR